MNPDLFGESRTDREISQANATCIPGLGLYPEFISTEEEALLLEKIDHSVWLTDLKRRVQHYGYRYDYRARRVGKEHCIGPVPGWMAFLHARLLDKQLIDFVPDQAIVNEYLVGQGIAAHIDCEPCFGDMIVSISLGSQCVMDFQRAQAGKAADKVPLLIPRRALLVMKEESRYGWYHGITGRKTDRFNGSLYPRTRRVSITFRKVILDSRP